VRSYVRPVLVRATVLSVVSWAFWIVLDVIEPSAEDFTVLLVLPMSLAGIAAAWAAVDGVRGGCRGERVGVGLLVWLSVALATGLLQPVLVVVQDLLSGRPLEGFRLGGHLRVAFFYTVFLAVPAAFAFGLAWMAARRFSSSQA
jgi:hypothetical protein